MVNAPTAKRMPYSLSMARAWAETSITTYSAPLSSMCRSRACTSSGSGVVSLVGIISSPIMEPTVPM